MIPQILPRVVGSPWLRRAAFAFASELGIRYRRSVAVAEGEPRLREGPRAGDRLPDARLLKNGRIVYLQQAIAGPHLALVLCGNPQTWNSRAVAQLQEHYGRVLSICYLSRVPFENSLVDSEGEAFMRLGVQDDGQYLVRPDGYIAYRASGRNLEQLERYLLKWYLPK